MDLIPSVVKNVLLKLEENGFEAYIVGGAVRDFLFHRETNDFDIATNALLKDILQIFGPSRKNMQYGSFHLTLLNYNIDITTYRKEISYKDYKLFEMEYTNNLIFDASRRDFTMNALYQNRKGEIIDPLDCQKDIQKKIIKMIGNPNIRLKEDPLRILRALRFASIYKLKLDRDLVSAIQKEKKNLVFVSKERVKRELDSILLADGFSLLKKLDLLDVLGIQAKKIVYVEDLAGLWAQLKCNIEYPKEKNLKKREKIIETLLKYDTMNMLLLYKYGYYDCRVASLILKFPLKKLEKMQSRLPIHSRKDFCISVEDIEIFSNLHGRDLGILLEELESNILLGRFQNTVEDIQKYIKER